MRNRTLIILFLSLFIILSPSVYGDSIEVEILNKKVKARPVPVLIDNVLIEGDTPAIAYIDRTLVPVRMISEKIGAEVTWVQENRSVIIDKGGNRIIIFIDKDIATINGENLKMDTSSIPRLVGFTGIEDPITMVPLNFLASNLDYQVDWDPVKKVALLKEKKEEEPLYFEFTEEYEEEEIEEKIDNDRIEENQAGDIRDKIKIEREDLVHIGKVSLVEDKEGAYYQIEKEGQLKYKKTYLKKPERIVLDIEDAILIDRFTDKLEEGLDSIKGIRMSQYSPDKEYTEDNLLVRLVFDMNEDLIEKEIEIIEEEDRLIVKAIKTSLDLVKINEEIGLRDVELDLDNLEEYSIDYLEKEKKISIKFKKGDLDIKAAKVNLDDMMISQIEIIEEEEDFQINFYFRRSIIFEDKSADGKIAFRALRNNDIKKSDRIIVIDPGHGAKDPGAVSKIDGTKEVTIVNQVAFPLAERLESLGYQVILSRELGEYVDNKERARNANEAYADIYVSIHANATDSPKVNGIEVLYTKKEDNPRKGEQQLDLAKAVLKELISNTGAVNRGLVNRPRLIVIRDTEMPSILVELGFITNEKELKNLKSPSYQNILIDSIINGIEKYFEKY